MRAPPRLSPSDVSGHCGEPVIELAGRVLSVRGRSLTVADAFALVEVELAAEAPVTISDLVVAAGRLVEARVVEATLVTRIEPMTRNGAETGRLVDRGVGRGLLARARGLEAVRSLFDQRGFIEVSTPAVVPSPGLDLHLDAFEVPGASFGDGIGYLITSPEYQMKRLLAGGVPRCFQIGSSFRKGEVGRRHNPEFSMLEWYRAFAEVSAVMEDTEALVRRVAQALGAGDRLNVGGARVDLSEPFERLAVGDAFARHAGIDRDLAIALASTDEDRFFRVLVDEVEPALASYDHPVFLVDYPAPCASLARLNPTDPRVAERFELYVAGVELCNGFGELTDAVEQRARLVRDQTDRRKRGLPVYPIDERFLAALEEGMPPAAGNALGLDRLLAVCLGTESIGVVQSFPVDVL